MYRSRKHLLWRTGDSNPQPKSLDSMKAGLGELGLGVTPRKNLVVGVREDNKFLVFKH